MKHPLIIWLILVLLVTAILAAGWTERLGSIFDRFKASSDEPQMLAASAGILAPVRSRSSSLRLVSLASNSGSLLQAGTTGDQPAIPTSTPVHIPPQVVPFLNQTVPHDEFELTDRHGEPECLNCHSDGRYTGTESTCQACHGIPLATEELLNSSFREMYNLVEKQDSGDNYNLYPDHFGERCDECHDSGSWEPVAFDHKGIFECISCHAGDIPTVRILPDPIYLSWLEFLSYEEVINDPDHFPGDCQFCHTSTTDWKDIWYTHEYVFECESCHLEQAPELHYSGPCASCHSNYDYWPDASVNHEHLKDCLGCHSTHVSDDHILGNQPGMCSTCHSTVSWDIKRYNHSVSLSCTTCHSKPSGHYSGNCSQCHDTRTWVPEDFFHSNAGDCQRCHSNPENHYPGSCSSCHTTRGWRSISYDHMEVRECAACHQGPVGHYSGLCSACHNTTNWSEYTFDHLGYLYCIDCHASNEPDNHYSDDCYACHDVNSWGNASRYHSSTSDCGACHTAPEAHYFGQCSSCHNTVTWGAINFDHSRYTICTECHDAPSGHWPGACNDCHNTESWADYTFNHTGYNICNACHDRPDGHSRGQCSKCHNTESWVDLTTSTPTPTPAVSPTITNTPTPRTKPGQTSTPTQSPTPSPTPSPTALPPMEANLTPTPQPTPTSAPVSTPTPTPPAADIETPNPGLTPIVGTLQPQPEPGTTLTATPTETPAIQPPGDRSSILTLTPQPGTSPQPGLTPVPQPVSTISLPVGGKAAPAGSESSQDQGYMQVITRVFDRAIRLIITTYNQSWKDGEPPPTWRRPDPPTVR